MASAAEQTNALTAEIKTLVNARLKELLREESLQVGGVKSELQMRIISHIRKMENSNDLNGLARMRDLISGRPRPLSQQSYAHFTPPNSASPQFSASSPFPAPHVGTSSMGHSSSKMLNFKPSPFYKIVRSLTNVQECKAREHTRDTIRMTAYLSPEHAELLQRDSNMRVMVYCSSDPGGSLYTDVAFPHQVELKCNSEDVKANLRGLKNKPGSTRPADVTAFIRKKKSYANVIELTYALTQKNYYLVVNLVQRYSIESLVHTRKASVITREQVRQDILKKRDDPDIQTTSTVLSLKCPLSAGRIIVPMRSEFCKHNQCFDATSYLQMQEQAPTWTCPICNRQAPYERLQVDLYVDDILKRTPKNTEQVVIEPDGQWHLQDTNTISPSAKGAQSPNTPDDDDDEGIIEIRDPGSVASDRVTMLRAESRLPTLNTTIRTPPTSSREQSIASSSAQRSTKRPAGEVIDLTLSDDDNDDGARPAKIKRPSMSSHTNPFRNSTHLGSASALRSASPASSLTPSASRPYSPFSFTLSRPTYDPSGERSPFERID